MTTVYDSKRYRIDCNGTGASITRKSDGASVFFQGDDAAQFAAALDATHDKWTYDDACSEYDHVMEAVTC